MRYIATKPFAAGLLSLICSAVSAAPTTEILILNTDPLPGGNGSTFRVFTPLINDSGQILTELQFSGTSGGAVDDTGLYLYDRSAGLTPVMREGQTEVGTTSRYREIIVGSFNNAGQAYFSSQLDNNDNPLQTSGIYFVDADGTTTKVARTGDAAPDNNGVFGSLQRFRRALNDNGRVVFDAFLSDTASVSLDDRSGLFYKDPGGPLVQLARGGDPSPDGNGVIFIPGSNSVVNNHGQVAFTARLANTNNGSADDEAVYLSDGGTGLSTIARKGADAPDGNGAFDDFFSLTLNNAGQAVFRADLSGTSGGSADDNAAYYYDPSTGTQLLLREGEAAPDGNGTLNGVGTYSLNDSGRIAFTSVVSNTAGTPGDNVGVFMTEIGGATTQIFRGGTAAIDGNGTVENFTAGASINNAGQIIFTARLTGTTGGTDDDQAIYFYDPDDGITEIIQKGDALLGSTITGFSIALMESNQRSGLNESGQVAYGFTLADGRSGIALWSPFLIGDLNDDGSLDNLDIDPFVMALIDAEGYAAAYPYRNPDLIGDFNRDGVLNNLDIYGLVSALDSPPSSLLALVPEPASLSFIALGGLILVRRRPGQHR
ncbi:MAG: choice-of-anchor tandem repeat NxxGxxAF-containing protein [Planctomycetota bacterium]